MARKYDRYGRNRQFRRNPTRSRYFFPYRLPFQNDFRLKRGNGTEVSALTAARWRQVVADITRSKKRKHDYLEDDGYYQFMQQTQTPVKKHKGAKIAGGIVGASVLGDAIVHTNGLVSGGLAWAAGLTKNPVVRRYAVAAVL